MPLREPGRLVVLAACATLLLPAPARGAEGPAWRHAIDRLAYEKTLAEGCISLLKSFAARDPMGRVQGQRLYARARADVDGLIALLKVDLAGDRSPAAIPELKYRLEGVPRQRQTLCQHVDAAVGTTVRELSERSGAVELLAEGAANAGYSPLDTAVQIWKAYRRAGDAGRERIIFAIEGARWRDYAEIPPSTSR